MSESFDQSLLDLDDPEATGFLRDQLDKIDRLLEPAETKPGGKAFTTWFLTGFEAGYYLGLAVAARRELYRMLARN